MSLNITGEMIAEAMRKAGMEVQYFPLHRLVPADQMKPHTMGSEDLNKIAAALNDHMKGANA